MTLDFNPYTSDALMECSIVPTANALIDRPDVMDISTALTNPMNMAVQYLKPSKRSLQNTNHLVQKPNQIQNGNKKEKNCPVDPDCGPVWINPYVYYHSRGEYIVAYFIFVMYRSIITLHYSNVA